ncbi:hypothetical protein [Haloferula sp. BvORR071]|uniref:hypothetical protein n=1 Tax=Haloferula sp. BvORR071 TaxID=1396141 RepID=UPI000558EDF1|nr:hypothetical protein [Haloferula sp. BvORR071]
MDNDVYVREAANGLERLMSAEIVDTWEDGCLIRSEEALSMEPGTSYYVEEGDHLVAVHFGESREAQGPFDYAAQKDRTDVRRLPSLSGSR